MHHNGAAWLVEKWCAPCPRVDRDVKQLVRVRSGSSPCVRLEISTPHDHLENVRHDDESYDNEKHVQHPFDRFHEIT